MAEKTVTRNEVVVMDYGNFEDVQFINCKIVYRGGRAPSMIRCDLIDCEWIFEGPALNTVGFLRGLSADDGSRQFVLSQILALPNNG